MKDFMLFLALLAAAAYGYFLMGRIDAFEKEVRRNRHTPPKNKTLKKRKK